MLAWPPSFEEGIAGSLRITGILGRGVRRSLMTALAFALRPQRYSPWPWLPDRPSEGCVFFTDTAERRKPGRYMIGTVRARGRWCSYAAPAWIGTLQQAELYAVLFAMRLGCYMRLPYAVVGIDSDVSRS